MKMKIKTKAPTTFAIVPFDEEYQHLKMSSQCVVAPALAVFDVSPLQILYPENLDKGHGVQHL